MSKTQPPQQPPQQPPPQPPQTLLNNLTTLDKSISQSIHNITTPIIPTFILKLLEISGDGRLWFPITLSLLVSLRSQHLYYSITLSLLVGLISDIAVIGLLKHLIRRPRPAHNSHPMGPTFAVDHWSFPSGHASRTCFIAAFFDRVVSCNPVIVRNWIAGFEVEVVGSFLIGGVWVWGLTTSVSRVFLGRHYVFDVVVGCLIGVLNGLIVHHFVTLRIFQG